MTFRPTAGQIAVYTYSPRLNAWRTGDESQFVLNVDFEAYATGHPALLFQQGTGGYAGTQDTWINEDEPDTSYGNDSIFTVDDDTTNGWFGHDYQGQGVLRFDSLIRGPVYEGEPEPMQVPTGATIHSATLTLKLADDCDICDPEFYIYRMLRDWNESRPWNSLSSGIVPGVDCESQWIASFQGDNNPDLDFYRTAKVLPALTARAAGQANHGFAILPERVSGCDDGIDIYSSEVSGLVANEYGELEDAVSIRPSLLIEYSYTQINVPPTVTAPLAASGTSFVEGQQVALTISAEDPNPMDPLTFRVNGHNWGYATGSGTMLHWELLPDEGTYGFAAEVLDDEAVVPAGAVQALVQNAAPEITALTPDLVIAAGSTFAFAAEAWDRGPLDVLTYAWDLDGDGQFDDFFGPSGVASFGVPDTYVVSVAVSDGDGGFAYGSLLVHVVNFGDADLDGDIDLVDFAVGFQTCFGESLLPPECVLSDFDGDDGVEMDDFEFWIDVVTGPGE